MAYTIRNPLIGVPQITSDSTVQQLPAGTIVTADDPDYGAGEFIYLSNSVAILVGTWCIYQPDNGRVSRLVANDIGPVCVSMAAHDGTVVQYGWYQIGGKAIGKALTGFLDNANVYSTATAGSVDDAVVAGDRVKNAIGASAVDTPSSGLAEFEIARPWVDDALAA